MPGEEEYLTWRDRPEGFETLSNGVRVDPAVADWLEGHIASARRATAHLDGMRADIERWSATPPGESHDVPDRYTDALVEAVRKREALREARRRLGFWGRIRAAFGWKGK